MYRGIFPAETFRGAFQGGIALYDQLSLYNDPIVGMELVHDVFLSLEAEGLIEFVAVCSQVLANSSHLARVFGSSAESAKAAALICVGLTSFSGE